MSAMNTLVIEAAEEIGADLEAFLCWVDYQAGDVEYAAETFEEAYCGQWESLEEYAEQTMDDMGDIYVGDTAVGWRELNEALARNGFHAPKYDQIAWECDHTICDGGHVFRTV